MLVRGEIAGFIPVQQKPVTGSPRDEMQLPR